MLNVVWTQGVNIKGEAAGLGKDGVLLYKHTKASTSKESNC